MRLTFFLEVIRILQGFLLGVYIGNIDADLGKKYDELAKHILSNLNNNTINSK